MTVSTKPTKRTVSPPDGSWAAQDLTDVLDGTFTPEQPTLLRRTDGHHLIYAGRVHSFHGESESGKSMLATYLCADELQNGNEAAYLDFESDKATVVGRLLAMDVAPDDIRDRFHYIRPDHDPRGKDDRHYASFQRGKYSVIVIDGVTEASAVFGFDSMDNDGYTAWSRTFVRQLARRTGAAVVLVDHVTKDSDSRGRYALGGVAKLNTLDGAAFVVEVKEPLGVGMRGIVSLRVAKDRPGSVRPRCGTYRKGDRTQEAALITVESTDGYIIVSVDPPGKDVTFDPNTGGAKRNNQVKPTKNGPAVLEAVQRLGPCGLRDIKNGARAIA